jgi:hypothetical protein
VILTMFTLIAPTPDNSFLVFSFMVAGILECASARRSSAAR